MQGNDSNLMMSEVITASKQVNSFINIYKRVQKKEKMLMKVFNQTD